MDESRQPMGECKRSQGGLNLLSPQGTDWSTTLSPLQEQPLNQNAYSNQAQTQAPICSSTYCDNHFTL